MPAYRWKFTVPEYHCMASAGIFGKDDHVELLEGEIVKMAPIGPPHAGCVNRLTRLFSSLLGDRVVVGVQNPISLGWMSEPQPDVALLRPRRDLYSEGHPEPKDVLLVVEVASSTSAFDREVKMPLYAQAGIPQAGLVNLDEGVVEVYRLTGAGGYGDPELVTGEGRVVVDAFGEIQITVADIL